MVASDSAARRAGRRHFYVFPPSISTREGRPSFAGMGLSDWVKEFRDRCDAWRTQRTSPRAGCLDTKSPGADFGADRIYWPPSRLSPVVRKSDSQQDNNLPQHLPEQ